MNTANVYDHPTVSWDKAKTAWDQIQRKEGELLTHWVELGQQLIMLRKSNPSNKDFGNACVEHGIDMSHQHRKAAMWWAGLSQDQQETLREYNPAALHPAALERRCYEQFPEWITSTRVVLRSAEDDIQAAHESPITAETASEPSETVPTTEEKSEDLGDGVESGLGDPGIRLDSRSVLFRALGMETAKKITSCWTNKATIRCFNALARSPGGKAVLKQIAEWTETQKTPITLHCNLYLDGKQTNSFSHRVFVPHLPKQWARHYGCAWDNVKAIKVILTQIPDAIRMNRELGDAATLQECEHWWRNRDKPRAVATCPAPVFFHEPNLEAFSIPQSSERMDKPAIGAEHEPIRVHTVDIWPNPHAKYDFEQAWAAFHFWQDIGRHMASLKDEGSEVRGRFLMELRRWLEYASDGFANAFHKIAAAEHQHPDKGFDTTCPPKQFRTK